MAEKYSIGDEVRISREMEPEDQVWVITHIDEETREIGAFIASHYGTEQEVLFSGGTMGTYPMVKTGERWDLDRIIAAQLRAYADKATENDERKLREVLLAGIAMGDVDYEPRPFDEIYPKRPAPES